MNRQQFLAELNQYLTFFSPEERAMIITGYNEKFDVAGPECEASVLAELGTPMLAAIDLKRRMEAGEKIDFISGTACAVPQEEPLSEYSVETETEATLAEPDIQQAETDLSADEVEAYVEEAPTAPNKSGSAEHRASKKPSRTKTVFALIGATLLSIVLAALFLVIAAVGAGMLVAMSYLLLTGLKNLVYVTDALMLFGGGLVCGGFGLIIVWFAVWSAIRLISSLYRGACGHGR